jgi:hypothetical protein
MIAENNYIALMACICSGVSSGKALKRLGISDTSNMGPPPTVRIDTDAARMARMHDGGMTFEQVGAAFGLATSTVFVRIKRLRG